MIAQHLFLLHFLGQRDAETDRLLATSCSRVAAPTGRGRLVRRPCGFSVTWRRTRLKLAGVDAGDATRVYIRRSGGVARTRIFTRASSR